MKDPKSIITGVLIAGALVWLVINNVCCSETDCETQVCVVDDTMQSVFERNCTTVEDYEESFCNEDIDYDKFYSVNSIIKGTTIGSIDTMRVEDRKIIHQEMFQKYDFEISKPLNFLPGVNAETKEMDGSVRMYFNLTVTHTENNLSVTIPMYESYDFDEDGKIAYLQYYGDITAAFQSLELPENKELD